MTTCYLATPNHYPHFLSCHNGALGRLGSFGSFGSFGNLGSLSFGSDKSSPDVQFLG